MTKQQAIKNIIQKEFSPLLYRCTMCLAFIGLLLIYLSSSLEAHIIRYSQSSTRSAADEVILVTDHSTVKLMSLGYNQAAADVLWLRSIQYFVSHLLTDRRYPWLGHFVDQMIKLDPLFKHVYLWAGSCLLYGGEITPAKVHASNRIYEAALQRFPNDYEPAYRLGMNYYSELKVNDVEEREKYRAMGIAYFERAAQAPDAPSTVFDLLRGIAKQMNRNDVLFYALTDELLRVTDPERRKHLESRITQLTQQSEFSEMPSTSAGIIQWIEQGRKQETERQARFPYIKPLDYEWIFSRQANDLSWQSLIHQDSEKL